MDITPAYNIGTAAFTIFPISGFSKTNARISDITAHVANCIHDSFIPAFIVLRDMLVKKLDVVESDWV